MDMPHEFRLMEGVARRFDAKGPTEIYSQTVYSWLNARAEVPHMTAYRQSTALPVRERQQFRFIYGVAFVVFLTITLIARLLPRRLRPWVPVSGRRLSFVAEARAVTNTVIPFAFL